MSNSVSCVTLIDLPASQYTIYLSASFRTYLIVQEKRGRITADNKITNDDMMETRVKCCHLTTMSKFIPNIRIITIMMNQCEQKE
jgi:hypothetical protein